MQILVWNFTFLGIKKEVLNLMCSYEYEPGDLYIYTDISPNEINTVKLPNLAATGK